ncbi:hypothetical protein AB6E04_07185 [Vibrio amylolyticus]|uniref:hypothetical protein n=1 Tax=Vibrio amylolyticus TaxID=2847292 RepID=UPI00354ADFAF
MNIRKQTLALCLTAMMTGCTAIEKQVTSDIGNNLSEPYHAPQIVLDINTQTQRLSDSTPHVSLKNVMNHWHVPSLIAAKLVVPEGTSKRVLKRLETQFGQAAKSVNVKTVTHADSEFILITHSAIASLTGCDNSTIKPEIRDGKTGYSPALECSTLSNLIASVADPRDLLSGKKLQQPTSINATSALQNYYSGSVIAPSLQAVSVGGSQ